MYENFIYALARYVCFLLRCNNKTVTTKLIIAHHNKMAHMVTRQRVVAQRKVGKSSYANATRMKIVIDLEPRPRLVPDVDADRQPSRFMRHVCVCSFACMRLYVAMYLFGGDMSVCAHVCGCVRRVSVCVCVCAGVSVRVYACT